MRKLLIFVTVITSLILSACSTIDKSLDTLSGVTEIIPDVLDETSLIYRPSIIQGNIVSQEQMNQLKPGMSKQQVRFVLGTPTLQDTFHAKRWDYNYTQGIGSTPGEIKKLSVYFENDKLVRITGGQHPQTKSDQKPIEKAAVVKVPDWQAEETSIWDSALNSVGLGSTEED